MAPRGSLIRLAAAAASCVALIPTAGAPAAPAEAAVSPAAGPADLTLRVRARRVVALGSFRTSGVNGGTLRAATRAFGRPSSRRRLGSAGCRVGWRNVGVRAIFANLGGGGACDPRSTKIQNASLRSRRWQTARGLAVGDPTSRVRRLHPEARFVVGTWILYTAPDRFGGSGLDLPIVDAPVEDGRVSQFRVQVGAAGD